MVVFLNPYCSYGSGRARWDRIKEKLHRRKGKFKTEEIQSPDTLISQVSQSVQAGEDTFIAGGGDGTVNLLLNAIMLTCEDISKITLGAVGLGSSNDFHKPFRKEAFIEDIPVKTDFMNAFPHDVIRIDYQEVEGHSRTRFCLINSSVGVAAETNALFNAQPKFVKLLRKVSVNAAIVATTLKIIFTYRTIPCSLTLSDGEPEMFSVTNLGVIKNPHFAASLYYDTPIKPDDGKLGINLCESMSRLETVGILIALSKGRFQGRPKTRSWTATRFSVKSERVFALEMDGEVTQTKHADFSVVPKAVRCCP